MLACSAMVACTSEDSPEVNNGNENGAKNTSYVGVKLIMNETGSSRATTDGGYKTGDPSEQNIEIDNSIFLFYDGAGNYVTFGTLVGQVDEDNTTEGNHSHNNDANINSIYGEKFIALSASEDAVKNIDQVLTIVNYHNRDGLKNKPLSEVLDIISSDENNKADARADENFLMTTSVYLNSANKVVNTTAIDDTNICATQSEAYGKAIKIYIERAAAKVEVKSGAENASWLFSVEPTSENVENDENKEADIVVDGELTPVYVKVLGWTINNYNTEGYLVKKIEETATPFTDWNNVTDFRSYWAWDTNYNYEGSPTITTLEGHNAALATKSFKNAIEVSEDGDDKNRETPYDIMYCYEHAKAQDADNVNENRSEAIAYPNVTTVLVAGQILLSEDAEEGETLYKYNGIYYREAAYKSMVASFLRKYKNAEGKTMEETDWSIELAEKVDGQNFAFGITIELAEGVTLETNADLDAINAEVAAMYVSSTDETTEETTIHTEVFTDGYCYYQIPIEHLPSSSSTPLYGVIRNHWYVLTINGVAHVGEPVADPEKTLPEIPDKETAYYLAAELHGLSWHVVEQGVTLQ